MGDVGGWMAIDNGDDAIGVKSLIGTWHVTPLARLPDKSESIKQDIRQRRGLHNHYFLNISIRQKEKKRNGNGPGLSWKQVGYN